MTLNLPNVRLVALLVVLTVLPAACVLWFMNAAVVSDAAAAQQRVMEAYRGQLRLVRSRLDGLWRAQAARLDASGDPERAFDRLIEGEAVDGLVLLAMDGGVSYPRRERDDRQAAALSAQLSAAARLTGGDREAAVAAIVARLNDYGQPLPAATRLRLMDSLRALAPNAWMPTHAALRLSFEAADAERPVPMPDVVRHTTVPDIWALTSADHRVVAFYRTGRLEAMMHDFLHQISPEGVVFIAYPPDVPADREAIAAGPWLPGWQLSFVPLDKGPSPAVSRQRTVYVSVALAGIAAMLVAGVVGGRSLQRHAHVAGLKTDLVAAASHELRTPVASMKVLVDGLLADRELDPQKTREYLVLMASENARLARLVDNFLTFARLERERPQFDLAPVAPAAIVSEAVAAVRHRLPVSCDLRVEAAADLPPVLADRDGLVTALVNLLDNALKYTSADKRIACRAEHDGDAFVAFVVEDNGRGIPVREQRRIFRRFYRVDRRLTRETPGVGLGLSIVSLVAREHGGTVSVRSAEGRGSTFTLRIPIAGAAA